MAVEVYVHKMSEHMDSAEVIQWLAREGDAVAEHQPLLEVMTDKFTVELEAPAAGILAGIRPGCGVGATVPVGEAIAYIVQPGEYAPRLMPFAAGAAPSDAVAAAEPAETQPEEAGPADSGAAPRGGEGDPAPAHVKSTPVARRMARQAGLDIETLQGTGPGGRVVEADITAALAARAQPVPAADGRAGRWAALTPIQRITGERMRESVVTAPQFALEVTADATNLLWLKEALDARILQDAGVRLTLTALLVRIVAECLVRHPLANAEFAGERIKLHGDVDLGVAVGTDQGLVVPVVRQAQSKSLAQVAAELAGFQEKARTLRFTSDDLSGGTFTLSNLGMYGVERFAAIVNPPQAAILATGAIVRTPVALAHDQVAVRPRMALTLTVDHRVLDGIQAARFLAEVKEKVEKPYFLL